MSSGQISNLKVRPELYDQTIKLIESSFDYSKGESFQIDFFPLVEKKNAHHNFILEEGGEVLGHVGVKTREIGNTNLKLKVALIGGVAVSEKHRGKGFLTKLLTEVFKKFDKNVGLYILWGDEINIYKKFDFYLAGGLVESIEAYNPNFNNRYTKTKFKDISIKDFNQIKRIYQEFSLKNYISFLRNDEEWETLKKIESVDLYILKSKNEKILGYFCQNKGMDLKGIVHEFGYLIDHQNEISELFHSLKTWYPSSATIKFPGKNIYQALFRMGNVEIFNEFLGKRSHEELLISKCGKWEVKIKFKNKTLAIPKEFFFQRIFGPFPPKDLEEISCQFFFSGLDSV